MPDDPIQRLLQNPNKAVELTRLTDNSFGNYPTYFRKRIKQLAEALAAGDITVDEWLIAMRAEIDDLHHAAYMVGSGKQEQLNERDLAIIAAIVAAQFAFLLNWARQLGSVNKINPEVIESRANLYFNAANATMQKAQIAALGLPDLPAYPGDGTTECLNNCLCYWQIRSLEGQGNYDCYWVLGATEDHCNTCPSRAASWNPLRIRNGQIEPYDRTGLFASH